MFLVGLTGSIGTGKSTVAQILVENGIPVVDADVYARKGTPELTSAFISLRSTHDVLFTKRRNSASIGYSVILQKLVESRLIEESSLTPRQLRKKWENLLKRYRKLKHAATTGLNSSPRGSELTVESWPYYKDMEQILVKQEPLNHMLLPETISDQSVNFEMSEEYSENTKRFCTRATDDCATVQVLESLHNSPTQSKPELIHQTVVTSLSPTIVEPGKPAWKKIKNYFGDEVIRENGELDRTRLGQMIFQDRSKRKVLNEFTHPEIYKEIVKVCIGYFFKGYAFVVLDLPLLFEHGALINYMHKIIVVSCERNQQIERLISRDNMDESSAILRVQSQWTIEEKAKRANFVIDNSGTVEETKDQAERVMTILKDDKFHLRMRAYFIASTCFFCTVVYILVCVVTSR